MKGPLLALIAALSVSSAFAQTVTVTSLADSGPGTLRDAIASATPGGTIVFDNTLLPGTIALTSGKLVLDKDLTITGPGADRLAIDGTQNSRVFHVLAGLSVAVSDVTIQNGRAPDGGSSQPGEDGGGILNEGDLTLSQARVTGNRAGDGGVDDYAQVSGGSGGGIANIGTLTVIASQISNNTTGRTGDCAIYCIDLGSSGAGGGISSTTASTTTIERSTVSNNSTGFGGSDGVAGPGGGIYLAPTSGTLVVESSTISGNQTGLGAGGEPGSGGGLSFGGPVEISHSTITDNDGLSGGIRWNTATASLSMQNSIVAGNRGGGNPDDPKADCDFGNYTSNGYNLVGNGTGCATTGQGDHTVVPGDVLTTVLGPLADNGGFTHTHALLAGSPAIDKGSCSGINADQRGYGASSTGPRIVDAGPPNAADGCDPGAVEFQGTPLDLTVYFKRPDGWGYPHIHYLSTTPDIGMTNWPGEPMLHEGCGWYRWRFDGAGMAHMVFNGSLTPQTADLFRASVGWFDGTTDIWHETNPDLPCNDIVKVGPKVFLQGAYLGSELMSRALQTAGDLPATQPYSGSSFFGTPLKHNGVEFNGDIGPGGSVLATDWSIVELRTGSTADTKTAARAAIHAEDGWLIDPETLGQVEFPGVAAGVYHVVVRHRNHLPAMSKNKLSLSAAGTTYDFTNAGDKAYGTDPMVRMPDGTWAMWAGDADRDGDVDGGDFILWRDATTAGGVGYRLPDFNLDGVTSGLDFNLQVANEAASAGSQVP